jgi:predicted transcriptional regulator
MYLLRVPQPTIADIEAGRREPTMSLLSRIAESVGETLQARVVPLPRFSAVATANQIAERLNACSSALQRGGVPSVDGATT